MKSHIYIIIVIFISTFTSCLEEVPYTFEFEEQVFISGFLTNETGHVSLEIQKTISADTTGFNPIDDAQVSLFSKDTANSETFITDSFTVSNGLYTSSEEFTPTIGNSYWVEVVLKDGTRFKSAEEILKTSIALSIESLTNDDNEGFSRITFIDDIEEEIFYLVRFEYFEDENSISNEWVGVFDVKPVNGDTEISFDVFDSDENEGETLVVSVYNVSYDTFQFYINAYRLLNADTDALLSPPANLYGNMTNTTTNKIALGNFGVAGVSSVVKEF